MVLLGAGGAAKAIGAGNLDGVSQFLSLQCDRLQWEKDNLT